MEQNMNNESSPEKLTSDELSVLITMLVLTRWALTGPQPLDQGTLY